MLNEGAQKILAVTHSTLTKVRDLPLVSGMVNSGKIAFQFRTSDWDNTTKTAVFVSGDARISVENPIHVLLDENNECTVPHEVLNGTSFSVSVLGTSDNYNIPSDWMYYKYQKGACSDGVEPVKPTPSVYEQLLDKISKLDGSISYTKEEINELLGMTDDGVAILSGGSIIEERS